MQTVGAPARTPARARTRARVSVCLFARVRAYLYVLFVERKEENAGERVKENADASKPRKADAENADGGASRLGPRIPRPGMLPLLTSNRAFRIRLETLGARNTP